MITARRVAVSCALAALSVTVALAFGRVYGSGHYVVPLVVATLVPHVLGMAARARRVPVWLEVAVSGVILIVGSCVALGDFSPETLFDRLDSGWQIALHHAVPLPATPSTMLLGAIVVWIAATAADVLAFRHNASIGAIAPGAMVIIWIAALGDRDGQWLTIGSFGIASILFLAFQHQVLLERRRTRLGGRRFVDAPALVVVAVLSGIAAVTLGVAAAPALPGGDHPLFEGDLGSTGNSASYRTSPPLLNVGDELQRGKEEEVFTVKATTADYWRITALDQYRSVAGGRWTLDAQGDDAVGEGLDGTVPQDALTQDYRIGQLGERWMPAAYEPVSVSRSDTLVVRASATLVTNKQTVSGLRYRVESVTPTFSPTPAQVARAASPAPAALGPYTELPADFPEAVRATAQVVTRGLTSQFDKALALRDFFRVTGGFTYDTSVKLGDDGNAIAAFLSGDRHGFCVQFASAYATMARSLGIPARVAVGFTPGTPDNTGTFHVTNYDAHAWPEIWLTGLGWTHLFDPTPPSNDPGGSGLPTEPPPSSQSSATATTSPPVTQPVPQSTPASTPQSTPANGAAPAPAQNGGVTVDPNSPTGGSGSVWWVVIAVLVVLLLIVGPALIVLALKARRRAGRRAASTSSLAIEGAWREAIDELIDRRIDWPPSDTPHELAERVPALTGARSAEPMRNLADAYGQVRYGDIEPPTGARDAAWDNVDALRKALDSSSTPMERIRAHLSTARLRRQPDPAGWSLRRSPSTKD